MWSLGHAVPSLQGQIRGTQAEGSISTPPVRPLARGREALGLCLLEGSGEL